MKSSPARGRRAAQRRVRPGACPLNVAERVP